MIAFIKGTAAEINENSVVIDCNGMGYEINVSAQTASTIKADEEVKIYTYMSVSENGIGLYGFESRQKKELFIKLLSVSGVGPKAAMSITGAMSAEQLITAIATADTAALSQAQGIGKKTAQRIVLELKDKIDINEMISAGIGEAAPVDTVLSGGKKTEAVEALMSLGYSRSEAFNTVSKCYNEDDSVEKIIKQALRMMI